MLIRLLRRRDWLIGFGAGTLLAAVLVVAAPATAAFPGRNGLLAVQPSAGPGIVLVNARGRHERRICTSGTWCSSPSDPSWSRDGRSIAFLSTQPVRGPLRGPLVEVISPDGSCMACETWNSAGPGLRGGDSVAFTSKHAVVSVANPRATPPGLTSESIDGISQHTVLRGKVSDAAWSAQGLLAVVRRGRVWAGWPTALRPLGRGSSLSWSPDGSRLAIGRDGWVVLASITTHRFRRLVKGGWPAWSPDGRLIAFIGAHQRVEVVSIAGGHVVSVGHLRGAALDWQPLPSMPPAACDGPPGSTTFASSDQAVITSHTGVNGTAYMGCLFADGHERWLTSFPPTTPIGNISESAFAGDYAALVVNSPPSSKYGGGATSIVALYDLRTGMRVTGRGGEWATCDIMDYYCSSSIDQLVLGRDAVSAVRTRVDNQTGCSSCTQEQIMASDGTGTYTLDTVTEPAGSPPALSNLTLTGDTLTWNDNGTPHSAQLQP